MEAPRNQLARRDPDAPAARLVYTPAEPAPQYTVSHTTLGDFALHWDAGFLRGLFCVNDFPREWVAAVQVAFLGLHRIAVHDGAAGSFSLAPAITWDLSPWERAVGPFAHAPAGVWLRRDPLWQQLDPDAFAAIEALPKRGPLPLIRSLTLPASDDTEGRG